MSIEDQVNMVLDKIRSFIAAEGGDVTLNHIEDGIVYVDMHGACQGCSYADMTVSSVVKTIVMEEVPGIIDVRQAN